MTPRERRAFERYLRYLLDRLDLTDWVVELKPEPAEEGASPTFGQCRAALYLGADFAKLPPKRASEILVHELVHCHVAGVQHHAESDELEELLGKGAYAAWFLGFRQLNENAVDAIAIAWARRLDVIDWTDQRVYRR
jgi:hypothetical protein